MNQTNDSRVTIGGTTPDANGGSVQNVDLGRVFVGGAVPAAQSFTLNKAGNNGTYFEVTTAGDATSSITGRYNAFRTNQTDSKSIVVGLNTSTATAGLRSGTATIDNLDVTTLGGAGRGANDANDTINMSLAVLDHASPSFATSSLTTSLTHNFGAIAMGSSASTFNFSLFNLATTAGYTASMDFDSVKVAGISGSIAALTTNLAASAGTLTLAAGAGHTFTAMLGTSAVGTFSATYTLMLSDENLPGAVNKSIALMLTGQVLSATLAGDYNNDHVVDAADYVVWRKSLINNAPILNETITPGVVDQLDYYVWKANFGAVQPSGLGVGTAIPEPASVTIMLMGLCSSLCMAQRRR